MKGKNIRKGITSVAILSLVLCLMSTGVMHAEDDETVFTPSQDQSAEEKTAAGEQEKQTVSDTTEEQQQTPVSENQTLCMTRMRHCWKRMKSRNHLNL